MIGRSRRHTPLAATATATILLLLSVTCANGLQCYRCDDLDDCERTWNKLKADDFIPAHLLTRPPLKDDDDPRDDDNDNIPPPPPPPPPEDTIKFVTCSANEQCQLFFQARSFHHEITYMAIHRAGCATPPSDPGKLDDFGCFSTPTLYNERTLGTRSCYCKGADLCNHNRLKCYNCKRNSDGEGCDSPGIMTNSEHWMVKAFECVIRWTQDGKEDTSQSLEEFSHFEDNPRPRSCSSMSSKDWTTQQSCSCSRDLCNKIPPQLEDYLLERIPRCTVTHINSIWSDPNYPADCPRRTVCVSRYILEGGVHVLKDLGCEPPPIGGDGGVIRNGCNPPDLKSSRENRSCYCDAELGIGFWGPLTCNSVALMCVSCQGQECLNKELQKSYDKDGVVGKAKTKECFVTYDDTVKPPQLEAGVRDMTLKMDQGLAGVDPYCDRKEQKGWIGSKRKRSCRCETSLCNKFRKSLVLKYSSSGEDYYDEITTEKNLVIVPKAKGTGISNFKADGWARCIMILGALFLVL